MYVYNVMCFVCRDKINETEQEIDVCKHRPSAYDVISSLGSMGISSRVDGLLNLWTTFGEYMMNEILELVQIQQ